MIIQKIRKEQKNMESNPMKILIIEDDINDCNNFIACVRNRKDIEIVAITDSDIEGLKYVKTKNPEGIILDLELHEGGGNGLFSLSKLHDLGLEKLPYILITTQNTSNVTLEAARQLGADFIITKYERDYSAQKPVELKVD